MKTNEFVRSTTCPKEVKQAAMDNTRDPRINSVNYKTVYPETYHPNNNLDRTPCGTPAKWLAVLLYMPDNTYKVVGNNHYGDVRWDGRLGTWYFSDMGVITYIRGAHCIQIPLEDKGALDESACAPLPPVEPTNTRTSILGPPTAPFNRTWPCDYPNATNFNFRTSYGEERSSNEERTWINCVYGSWIYLGFFGRDFTTEIIAGSCVTVVPGW